MFNKRSARRLVCSVKAGAGPAAASTGDAEVEVHREIDVHCEEGSDVFGVCHESGWCCESEHGCEGLEHGMATGLHGECRGSMPDGIMSQKWNSMWLGFMARDVS